MDDEGVPGVNGQDGGALGGEDVTISDWQTKRDGNKRGILEVVAYD